MAEDEDKPLGLRLTLSFYLITILLLFFAIALQIFSGMQGWTWYVVIPLWAFINLGLRVLKTNFRNNLEAIVDEDIENEGHAALDVHSEDNSDQYEPQKTSNTKLTVVAIFAMLFVSTFWYGIGMIVSRFF